MGTVVMGRKMTFGQREIAKHLKLLKLLSKLFRRWHLGSLKVLKHLKLLKLLVL